MRGHAAVYRATGGRVLGRLPGLPPLLLLDHVGARSGKRRSTPLVYVEEGDDLLVAAAKGGHPRNPGWLHNLRAHPDVEIQIGSRRMEVRAHEVPEEEHPEVWARAVEQNPYWGKYSQRTSRQIPLVLLRPRDGV